MDCLPNLGRCLGKLCFISRAQESYISGIAQGANVDQSQVTIVSVTSASTVTVNTQVCAISRGRN